MEISDYLNLFESATKSAMDYLASKGVAEYTVESCMPLQIQPTLRMERLGKRLVYFFLDSYCTPAQLIIKLRTLANDKKNIQLEEMLGQLLKEMSEIPAFQ